MVKGLRSLDRKLNITIPRRVKSNLRTALAIWADKVVASAEAFVPEQSGDLKNSIGWVWGNEVPEGALSIGTVSTGDPDLTITVFAGDEVAYYARWVEFGTRYARANPYFFVSARLNKRAGLSRVSRAIRKGLREGSR